MGNDNFSRTGEQLPTANPTVDTFNSVGGFIPSERPVGKCACCGFFGAFLTPYTVQIQPGNTYFGELAGPMTYMYCDLCIGTRTIYESIPAIHNSNAAAKRECYIGNAIIAAIKESKL